MASGYLSMVLHAHLPFVRHLGEEHHLEEKWLFEAITETYIPLYRVFERLINDEIPFKITLSISPPLASMLMDSLLNQKYLAYLDNLISLAEKEVVRTSKNENIKFNDTAKMYLDRFKSTMYVYRDVLRCNLVKGFSELAKTGCVELITCAGTHGYLPLMATVPAAARAQIKVAVDFHTRIFGSGPKGMWLPECGYQSPCDEFLRECGVMYFFVDTHGINYASVRPRYGVYAPLYCPSGVAVFGRDMESSKQVWSAKEGYPGDFDYREFYRDIGYDLDYDYIREHLKPNGERCQTGMKYHRITGPCDWKEPYVRSWAMEKSSTHAGNFVFNRKKQVEYLSGIMDRKPIIVAPYDAELFGHWWFEGPEWLDFVLRKAACDQDMFATATPSDYLDEYPVNQVATPSMSSWGYLGYSEVWLSPPNDWIYRHLHYAAEKMCELANDYPQPQSEVTTRELKQAARELLLAQSSDWAFIMNTGTCVDYAIERTNQHISNFLRLYNDIRSFNSDERWLGEVEFQDNIFPDIDYEIYSTKGIENPIVQTA